MLELNFHPFPTFDTERLTLRRVTMVHSQDMFNLRADINAMRYLDRPIAETLDDAEDLIKRMDNDIDNNTGIGWGIFLKNTNRLIGTIGYYRMKKENYRAEIGYMLLPDFWKQGIMSEAMKPIINFGFNEMKLHSIEADINPNNEASAAILKKHGFVQEAYFKENVYSNGQFLDTEIYSLLINSNK
ncbi:MAG: GNAT family N-acetyltransferase [Bacteroidia bacterium]